VGDGPSLYLLAPADTETGQVDALLSLDGALGQGTCVDTSSVGVPLAFHLDAGGGELLLFRIEDDGDLPTLELRDAGRGRVWTAGLELPVARPGTLAAGLDGSLGEDLAVVARGFGAGERQPAVVAVDRDSGTERWRVPQEALEELAPGGDPGGGTTSVEVLGVGEGVVLLALARDAAPDVASFVALARDTGELLWPVDLGPRSLRDVALGGGRLLLAVAEEAAVTAYEIDLDTGAARPRASAAGGQRASVVAHGDRVVLTVDRSLVVASPEATDTVVGEAGFVDLYADADGVAILLRASDETFVARYAAG